MYSIHSIGRFVQPLESSSIQFMYDVCERWPCIFMYKNDTSFNKIDAFQCESIVWRDKSDAVTNMTKRTRSAINEREWARTAHTNDVTILSNMDTRACYDNASFVLLLFGFFAYQANHEKTNVKRSALTMMSMFCSFYSLIGYRSCFKTARSSCRIVFRLSFCSLSSLNPF